MLAVPCRSVTSKSVYGPSVGCSICLPWSRCCGLNACWNGFGIAAAGSALGLLVRADSPNGTTEPSPMLAAPASEYLSRLRRVRAVSMRSPLGSGRLPPPVPVETHRRQPVEKRVVLGPWGFLGPRRASGYGGRDGPLRGRHGTARRRGRSGGGS